MASSPQPSSTHLHPEIRLVVLTGAGISAESGIPTFRGAGGFWTIGSTEYRPQELATYAMFTRDPALVWSFYVDRLVRFGAARPNAGHTAIVEMERVLGDRFRLITQNIDGLHLDAGNSLERTYQIHGNIRFLRCAQACGQLRWPLPLEPLVTMRSGRESDAPLSAEELQLLRCPSCGEWARPHVLWFDEYYDEDRYYFDSSLQAARLADVLLVVGTSGATNLPMQVAGLAAQEGCHLIEVNPIRSAFTDIVERSGGQWIEGTASQTLPGLADQLNAE